MSRFAVIETGGKQYRVAAGSKIRVEKLPAVAGDRFVFDKVLLRADGDNVEVGMPHLNGAGVEAKVLRAGRERKKIVFKYHAKARYRKKKGHRQHFTEVEIVKI